MNKSQTNQSVISCMFCKRKLKDCDCTYDALVTERRTSS